MTSTPVVCLLNVARLEWMFLSKGLTSIDNRKNRTHLSQDQPDPVSLFVDEDFSVKTFDTGKHEIPISRGTNSRY